jgi:hypothetical protein
MPRGSRYPSKRATHGSEQFERSGTGHASFDGARLCGGNRRKNCGKQPEMARSAIDGDFGMTQVKSEAVCKQSRDRKGVGLFRYPPATRSLAVAALFVHGFGSALVLAAAYPIKDLGPKPT